MPDAALAKVDSMRVKLEIWDKSNAVVTTAEAENRVVLVHAPEYQEGDKIVFSCGSPGFYLLRLDDAIALALVYVHSRVEFTIPFERWERVRYSPRAFTGGMHLLTAEAAESSLVAARRNLAFNPLDQHGTLGMWPHAVANAETQQGSLFIACNAIDGICASNHHYPYPYQSWGTNKDPNAALTVEFGVPVTVDELVLTLRADYPHDSHWIRGTVEFSDSSRETLTFEKSDQPQRFAISPRTVTSMTLKELIKADDNSEFAALRQIEAWGTIVLP